MDSTKIDSSVFVQGSKILLATSIVALIIFLVLIVIHYTVKPIFSFLPSNVIETSNVQNYSSKTLYANSPAPADTKMTFNPPISELNKDKFTYTFDCYLNGSYRSTTVPRVLAYFDSAPVTIRNNNDLREFNGDSESDVPKLFTSENSDLVTKFQKTNFIIYIDPVKNDMKVGVFTVDKVDSTKKYLEIASIIPNIPINTPFQISMVLGTTFVEVYKDKKLINTYKIGAKAPSKVILNTGAVPTAGYGIYTPISFIGDNVKIGNVQLYNGCLSSGQIRDLTNSLKPVTFFR